MISFRHTARLLLRLVVALILLALLLFGVGGFVAWATLAPLDEGLTAPGSRRFAARNDVTESWARATRVTPAAAQATSAAESRTTTGARRDTKRIGKP